MNNTSRMIYAALVMVFLVLLSMLELISISSSFNVLAIPAITAVGGVIFGHAIGIADTSRKD